MSLRDASQSVDAGDAGGASVAVERWGEVRYREAWDRQVELGQRVADGTAANTLVVVTHDHELLGRFDQVIDFRDFHRIEGDAAAGDGGAP